MSSTLDMPRRAFKFLETNYGFHITSREVSREGWSITYINDESNVGVKLIYEFRSGFVFVMIYRLIDGKPVENTLPITDNSKINCIDFNDVLPPHEKMRASYEYAKDSPYFDPRYGLKTFVNDFASRLHKYGDRLLSGDFSQMDEVEQIIRRRAKELYRPRH